MTLVVSARHRSHRRGRAAKRGFNLAIGGFAPRAKAHTDTVPTNGIESVRRSSVQVLISGGQRVPSWNELPFPVSNGV
jgi:hypothetical protein